MPLNTLLLQTRKSREGPIAVMPPSRLPGGYSRPREERSERKAAEGNGGERGRNVGRWRWIKAAGTRRERRGRAGNPNRREIQQRACSERRSLISPSRVSVPVPASPIFLLTYHWRVYRCRYYRRLSFAALTC